MDDQVLDLRFDSSVEHCHQGGIFRLIVRSLSDLLADLDAFASRSFQDAADPP